MDTELILTLATLILTIITMYAGKEWKTAKTKTAQLAALLKTITDAAEDNSVSEREFKKIVDAAKKLITA